MTLGQAVRRGRFMNGEMKQTELAERLKVSRQTVMSIEKDRTVPAWPTAVTLARVLGFDLYDLDLPND